ncbi:hypothetical protein NKJ72_12045 [Mesorhizobium sp. M0045]|uniref:hypothetical protein n=1 Tax=Mesorhizobium sp. M0045 TaxID=2956857 RepID=UPI003339159F
MSTFTQPIDWDGNANGFIYIVDANERKVGTCWGPTAERIANANLWTASPNMLEVLEAILSYLPPTERVAADNVVQFARRGRP